MNTDLTGKRFCWLVVIEEIQERDNRYIQWLCQCSCGKMTIVRGSYLRTGKVKSCGCRKALFSKHAIQMRIKPKNGGRKIV